jgi:MraZ protein
MVVESGVNMFGTYVRRLDTKKRIAIPPKLKSGLGNVVFVSIGIDQVIEIRSKSTYETLCTKFKNSNEFSRDYRNFKRAFFGNTEEVRLDKLSRVLLPAHLLTQTSIKTDIVMIGVDDKVEI